MGFSTLHIASTAALVAVASLAISAAMLRPRTWPYAIGTSVVAGLSTFGYRLAANVDALNSDGVPWVSANDALAGIVTYVALDAFAAIFPPVDPQRFRLTQTAVAATAIVINVVAI